MKKIMGSMLMLLLAGSMSAMAQSNTTGDSTMQMKMKSDKMMSQRMSMTGCVMEKDGKYMMMDKAHPDGVQLMTTEDLKPHVGHKMKMTGMMEMMSDMGTAKPDSTPPADATMKHDMGMMEMNVSSMKMISKTCTMVK